MNITKPQIQKEQIDIPVGNGNCFMVTGRTALADPHNTDAMIVHGFVSGRGSLDGLVFGHAWIEKGAFVIDNSNGKQSTVYKEAFYSFGRIDKNEVKKYSFQEARQWMRKTGHFGAWELKNETTKTY